VACIYAGILGLLAFLTCLVRGLMHGESPSSVLLTASLALAVFALIGSILGWLAGQAVEDSVRGRLQAELAGERSARSTGPSPSTS
jgi:putative Mn2+ efflux pump MntP